MANKRRCGPRIKYLTDHGEPAVSSAPFIMVSVIRAYLYPRLAIAAISSHIASMKDLIPLRLPTIGATLRFTLFILGATLMIVSPLAGLLPGPGGIIVFAIGLGLTLRNSAWAKRRYVDFKRRFPRPADWADWGMRRQSRKRRAAAAKQQSDG